MLHLQLISAFLQEADSREMQCCCLCLIGCTWPKPWRSVLWQPTCCSKRLRVLRVWPQEHYPAFLSPTAVLWWGLHLWMSTTWPAAVLGKQGFLLQLLQNAAGQELPDPYCWGSGCSLPQCWKGIKRTEQRREEKGRMDFWNVLHRAKEANVIVQLRLHHQLAEVQVPGLFYVSGKEKYIAKEKVSLKEIHCSDDGSYQKIIRGSCLELNMRSYKAGESQKVLIEKICARLKGNPPFLWVIFANS